MTQPQSEVGPKSVPVRAQDESDASSASPGTEVGPVLGRDREAGQAENVADDDEEQRRIEALAERIRKSLGACAHVGTNAIAKELLDALADWESGGIEVRFDRVDTYWMAEIVMHSNGVYDGGYFGHTRAIGRDDCRVAADVEVESYAANMVDTVRFAHPPAKPALAALAKFYQWTELDPGSPEGGIARLLTSIERKPSKNVAQGVTVSGPERPEQPWFKGPPRSTPSVLVSEAQASALRLEFDAFFAANGRSSLPSPPGTRFLRIKPTEDAVLVARFGDRELHQVRLPVRLGGPVVAIYEPERNRHRWVVAYPSQASWIRWVGTRNGIAVGEYRSEHGGEPFAGLGGIVLLRLADGASFRLTVPGAFEDGKRIGWIEEEEQIEAAIDSCIDRETDRLGREPIDAEIDELYRACETASERFFLESRGRGFRVRHRDGKWRALPWGKLVRTLP